MGTAFGGINIFFGVVVFLLERSWAGFGVALLLIALGITILVKWRRQGIYANSSGLIIRGGFTTREVAWAQVRVFELRPVSYQAAPVTFVQLVDGTSVPARALYGGRLPSMDRRAQTQIDELNALARSYQARPSSLESGDL